LEDWIHRYWPAIASMVSTFLILFGWRRSDEKDRLERERNEDERIRRIENDVMLIKSTHQNHDHEKRDIWEAITEIRNDNKKQTTTLGQMDGKLGMLIQMVNSRKENRGE